MEKDGGEIFEVKKKQDDNRRKKGECRYSRGEEETGWQQDKERRKCRYFRREEPNGSRKSSGKETSHISEMNKSQVENKLRTINVTSVMRGQEGRV